MSLFEEINRYTPLTSDDFASKLERLVEIEKHVENNPIDYERFKSDVKKISGQAKKLKSTIEKAHSFSRQYIQQEQMALNQNQAACEDLATNGDTIDFERLRDQLNDISLAGSSYLAYKGKPGAPEKIFESRFIQRVAWQWRRSFGEWPPLTEDGAFGGLIKCLFPRIGFKPVSFKKIIGPAIKLTKEKYPYL